MATVWSMMKIMWRNSGVFIGEGWGRSRGVCCAGYRVGVLSVEAWIPFRGRFPGRGATSASLLVCACVGDRLGLVQLGLLQRDM